MLPGHAVFDTPIGFSGIAWSARAVSCVQLPVAHVAERGGGLRAQLYEAIEAQIGPSAERPFPAAVRKVVAALVRHLGGKAADLGAIDLDMDGISDFHRRVYEMARMIPAGETI